MDFIEADTKMSLWGEFDSAQELSDGNAAPQPSKQPLSNVQPTAASESTDTSVSEKKKTLSTNCNSKDDLLKHLLRFVSY